MRVLLPLLVNKLELEVKLLASKLGVPLDRLKQAAL